MTSFETSLILREYGYPQTGGFGGYLTEQSEIFGDWVDGDEYDNNDSYTSKRKPTEDEIGKFVSFDYINREEFKNGEFDRPYRQTKYHNIVVGVPLHIAAKWLREKKNLSVEPYRTASGWLYTISRIPSGTTAYSNSDDYDGDDEDSGQWTTFELALEDGIVKACKKLLTKQ